MVFFFQIFNQERLQGGLSRILCIFEGKTVYINSPVSFLLIKEKGPLDVVWRNGLRTVLPILG